jgi:hypothetical protein
MAASGRAGKGPQAPCLRPLMPPALQVQVGGPRRVPPATALEQELRHFPPTNFVH